VDTITVLFCKSNHRATKIHSKTKAGIETLGFDAGMYFTCRVYPICSIHELSGVLSMYESLLTALVIRGLPQPHVDQDIPHQRTKNPPTANYQTPVEGHHHVMIDIDKLALPSGLELSVRTLQRVIEFVISQLPEEFHKVSFHWQLSSSAGISDPTKVSIHLWFWFDRSVTDDDLKR